VSDNLNLSEPTAEQLAAANAALEAGPQAPAPVVEAPAPVVEAPAPVVEAPAPAPVVEAPAPVVEAPAPTQSAVPVVDEKVDFWANSWFSRNK